MKNILLATLSLFAFSVQAKDYTLSSPDGNIRMMVSDDLHYDLYMNDVLLLENSRMELDIRGEQKKHGIVSGKNIHISEQKYAYFYRKQSIVSEYNAIILKLNTKETVEVRAYNSGVAYRFTTSRKGDYIIDNEVATFAFHGNPTLYLAHTTRPEKPMEMGFQATYDVTPANSADSLLAFLPMVADFGTCKLTLMEANLDSYPGMFVSAKGNRLEGVFAHYPTVTYQEKWRKQEIVSERADFIAKDNGKRNFPWRIMALSTDDRQMPVNDLVYVLSDENRIGDTSWIKPGKVAWDWWADWGLEGVPFKSGINMETYKHHIDFAQRYGLQYIILDEGWYKPGDGDMLTTIPEIDLPELVRYGQERGVGIILWTVFKVLDNQLEEACSKYSKMGIKGFKVDFLDRDDQPATEMAYRIADACAKHHLVLDYHGIYKPTGMNRTYPNILNWESVFGMEEVKWTKRDAKDMPLYDVTFPFIRMQSGFVDFTPGGMRNATRKDYQPVYSNPMTMGTRAHQAAHYILHDSPLTMLADNPSAYEKEPEYTRFLANIPNEWEETRILQGRMGEFIVTARRHGNNWYVAGETNWNARDITLPLDFLEEGIYQLTLIADGINSDKMATDHTIEQRRVRNSDTLHLHMAGGGGFCMRIKLN